MQKQKCKKGTPKAMGVGNTKKIGNSPQISEVKQSEVKKREVK